MSKTGWTEEARHTLVTAAERNGMTLVAVVMYSEKQGDKYDDTLALLNWCFDRYTTVQVTKDDMAGDIPSKLTFADSSTAQVEKDSFFVENFRAVVPKGQEASDLDFEFGYGTLNGDKTLAAVTVEAFFEADGEKQLCGQQDVSVIVKSDRIKADRSKTVNAVKRVGLTVFNILLWGLVIWCVFIALRQVVIMENRRRNRKRRKEIMEKRKRLYRDGDRYDRYDRYNRQ